MPKIIAHLRWSSKVCSRGLTNSAESLNIFWGNVIESDMGDKGITVASTQASTSLVSLVDLVLASRSGGSHET